MMLGLSPIASKVFGGVALAMLAVIGTLSYLVWSQGNTIDQLNKSVGGYEAQNRQLAADVIGLVTENRQLLELRELEEKERGEADAANRETIQRLQAEAAEWRRNAAGDKSAADFLDSDLPAAVHERLRELFPADGGEDSHGVPGVSGRHDQGREDAAVHGQHGG